MKNIGQGIPDRSKPTSDNMAGNKTEASKEREKLIRQLVFACRDRIARELSGRTIVLDGALTQVLGTSENPAWDQVLTDSLWVKRVNGGAGSTYVVRMAKLMKTTEGVKAIQDFFTEKGVSDDYVVQEVLVGLKKLE